MKVGHEPGKRPPAADTHFCYNELSLVVPFGVGENPPQSEELRGHLRKWWNWQTHHLEGVAPKGVGVQIPPSAPKFERIPEPEC